MAGNSAEIRGHAHVRPFRVAQLVDTTSSAAVRDAISNLSQTWGGYYTPIFDINLPLDAIEIQARVFDVDAVYLETKDGELRDQLRDANWLWRGIGPSGPFAELEGGFRTGVLPTGALALSHPTILLPDWDEADPLAMFYSAAFGSSALNAPTTEGGKIEWEPQGAQRVGFAAVLASPDLTVDDVGLIQTTRAGLSSKVRYDSEWINGLFVVRTENMQDLITFWNMRALGRPVVALPDSGSDQLLTFLTRGALPGGTSQHFGAEARIEKTLGVWGLANASSRTRVAIDAMAARLDMVVREHHSLPEGRVLFPGLDSRYKSSVRAEFPASARSVTVRVPSVPLAPGQHQVMPGIVAIEIDVHEVPGLDPRSTPSLPPFRRFGPLLERSGMTYADHVRVTLGGDGVVVGASATSDEVSIGFAYHLDAIATLFDDDKLKVSQSDDGRFQTRAAEMLGGPFGGVMVQPGVRALIDRAGRSTAGLTLQQLRAEVVKHRGAWPDKLASFSTSAEEYAAHAVNQLLFSGLFVPMLDVHCSNCRVDSQIAPRDLDSLVHCEFCGETFRLALSLALSKSRWRYRLASHLGTEKVKALLPALATSSLLGQLTPSGPAGMHAFGVEFKIADRGRMEADIVAYLSHPDWVAVLAEVKSGNWIDQNDVKNLEDLQQRLDAKKVRSVLAFATLKDRFAQEEVLALRGLIERSGMVTTAYGESVPRLPLALTTCELSLPWSDDDHPGRWGPRGGGGGIFATAVESCKRNLGLVGVKPKFEDGNRSFTCTWQDLPD